MYNVARNNFYENTKNSTVYTPKKVSDFLFSIFDGKVLKEREILDPCVGGGNLLEPFDNAGYRTIGIDIEDQGWSHTIIRNFLSVKSGEFSRPGLVIANPPFNIDAKTKEMASQIAGARPLLPEVWLRKIIELWGKDTPICLFTPYGMRLNQTVHSRRWKRFVSGEYPSISSIISLPKDIYDGILFHSEILVFNVRGLEPHYFYDADMGSS
jgi:type I restriction enzyme M protein